MPLVDYTTFFKRCTYKKTREEKTMKSKITKFSILLKEVSRVQKKCVQICISYLAVIGFFYCCGLHRNTRLGQVIWGSDANREWESILSKAVTSGSFQVTCFFLICFVFCFACILRYFSRPGLYYKYNMMETAVASLLVMVTVCCLRDRFSVDTIGFIIAVDLILGIASGRISRLQV